MLKSIRLVAWGCVALVIAGLLTLLVVDPGRLGFSKPPFAASIGGPFRLISHDGNVVTNKTLEGKPYAIFFGFTNCPDVCPTTMLEISEMMKELGGDADKIRFLFVTVDPEQDTAKHLKEYLANFDPRIIGLTGSAEEIATAAKAFRVFFEKVKSSDTTTTTFNHTATTYLMDSQGNLAGTIAYQEEAKSRLAKLKRLAGM